MRESSKNLIEMRTAAEMIDRHDQFRKSLKNNDSKAVQSIQFPIDAIETYLKYVKTLTRLRGQEVSGIRIVNAIYSSDHPDDKKRDMHTVLFIPTYKNSKGEDEAFDPLYFSDGEPQNLNELLHRSESGQNEKKDSKQTLQVRSSNFREGSEESSFMNFGGLGKPPIKEE